VDELAERRALRRIREAAKLLFGAAVLIWIVV
jgi:hypothetical protein